MMEYSILEAGSRKAKRWKQKKYTFHELAELLRQKAKRTQETMSEYAYWGRGDATLEEKEKRANAKDTYSYVCGVSANGRRGVRDIVSRSMLTLDIDHARVGVNANGWRLEYDSLIAIYEVACICHQTHSSTPGEPRLRMVIPLSREVTPLEYRAVLRKFAEQTGLLKTLDACSERVNQLMFAPTASKNAPANALEVLENDGEPLDVDEVLAAYGDAEEWEDAANWPLFPKESRVALTESVKLGDPGEKTDFPIIAAFCRAYDIEAAIDTFLADRYELSSRENGRYRYYKGSGAPGACVYDNGNYLYSNHTDDDPASDGHCHNAYDLVRIHLFGELDKDAEPGTGAFDLPSNRQMIALASGDEAVKAELKELVDEGTNEAFADILLQNSEKEEGGKIPYFFKLSKEGRVSGVQPALLAKWTREKLPYVIVRDREGAQRFYVYHDSNGRYSYCPAEQMQGEIKRFISAYSEKLVNMKQVSEAFKLISTDTEEDDKKNTFRHIRRIDELDSDVEYINFQNGLLRLSDLTLTPHTPAVLSTIQIPCRWEDQQTPTPVFDHFMDTLTAGDEDKQRLLIQVMGIAITNIPGWRMKKALFVKGAGDSGKSQFRRLIGHLTGEANNSYADLNELETRFGTSELYGKRVVGTADMKYAKIPELQLFKKATGGDSLRAEFKGQTPFNFRFNGVMVFCMNDLPPFGGDTGEWVYKRIMVVDCPNSIPEERQDSEILDKMKQECDGIAHRAVLAALEVRRNGYRYSEPRAMADERSEYRVDNSTVLSFYKECLRHKEEGEAAADGHTVNVIYDAYKTWCRDNSRGNYYVTRKAFRQELADYLGLDYKQMVVKAKDGMHFSGLRLTDDAIKEYAGCVVA